MQPSDMISHYESFMKQRRAGSTTAEGIALFRAGEAAKPEGERICYDQYSVHFIRPELLAHLRNQSQEKKEEERIAYEKEFPGHRNSILTRVRFFDDIVREEVGMGIPQVVIIGAGYDTRAYRIEGMKNARVFEVYQEETQGIKKSVITQIFGSLPQGVTYVPLDLRCGSLVDTLCGAGFDSSRPALFVIEGLLDYLPPPLVRSLLGEIAGKSASGSSILFDYFPQSVVDGTHPSPVAQNIRRHVASVGEPFLFGTPGGGMEEFLGGLGYRNVQNVTDREYLRKLFPKDSPAKRTTGLLSFCLAGA